MPAPRVATTEMGALLLGAVGFLLAVAPDLGKSAGFGAAEGWLLMVIAALLLAGNATRATAR